MKRVLVTGGAGFIGIHLVKKLLEMNYQITILDNLDPQVHGTNAKLDQSVSPHVSFILGDISDYHTCEQAVQNQDIIIHLASDTATGQSMYEITKCTKSNIDGIANLLQAIFNLHTNVNKIVLASSRAVYGEGKYICPKCGIVYPNGRCVEDLKQHIYDPRCPKCNGFLKQTATCEESELKPQSIYGATKITQELYLRTICKEMDIPYTILRFQNVYGEGQSLINPYTGILSIFSSNIMSEKPIEIFEDGQESRDFVHVEDVVRAVLLAVENNTANTIFNVGTGHSTTLLELSKLLYSYYDKHPNYHINHLYRSGDIRHNYADINKIKHILGYEPQLSLEEGLLKFTNWIKQKNYFNNHYEESLNIMKGKGILKSWYTK